MTELRDQIIATSATDSRGRELPEEVLREVFEQLPGDWPITDQHDPSLPPLGRFHNKRLKRLENGNLAIVADVHYTGDSLGDLHKAFSISLVTATLLPARDSSPEVLVELDPDDFDSPDLTALIEQSSVGFDVGVTVLMKRGYENLPLVVMAFASVAVAQGFLSQAGADAYAGIKSAIQSLKPKQAVPTRYQIVFRASVGAEKPEFLIDVGAADLQAIEASDLSLEAIIDHVRDVANDRRLVKVVVRIPETGGPFFIDHYIDSEGVVMREPEV